MSLISKKLHFLKVLVYFLAMAPVTAQYQWSVPVTSVISSETSGHPQAYLWIPENCQQVRAVVLGQHNMTEETIFEHPTFRRQMSKLQIAIIWVTPGFDMVFDFNKTAGSDFQSIVNDLASVSGYSELRYAPVIPIGHSAFASYPWNFAAWNPQRTLAVLSIHGDAPLTGLTGSGNPNPDWAGKNIDGVPGLMVQGEYEWMEKRVEPALDFQRCFPSATVSFLGDAGHGHFDISDSLIDYLNLFIKKAVQYRLPSKSHRDKFIELTPVDPHTGYLKERWKKDIPPTYPEAPYYEYKGNKKDAFWYFDKETARATEKFYIRARGKKEQYIGLVQNRSLLPFKQKNHARISPAFSPAADGLTFYIKAVFTDSARSCVTANHGQGKIKINRLCGPVKKINDTTFTVCFYRMGFNNQKRTGDIWLIAESPGDKKYKSSVQQFNIKIPLLNKEGTDQHISFPAVANVKNGTKAPTLNAISDSNMPVYFYIKEGPAEVVNGKICLTAIPPRSKFPIKVTAVAWQYGRGSDPKIKSAVPKEQSFYITE